MQYSRSWQWFGMGGEEVSFGISLTEAKTSGAMADTLAHLGGFQRVRCHYPEAGITLSSGHGSAGPVIMMPYHISVGDDVKTRVIFCAGEVPALKSEAELARGPNCSLPVRGTIGRVGIRWVLECAGYGTVCTGRLETK